ncbi:hypothetical protein D0817_05625 [Flavobacterium cupreum]|uniref:AraC family transcriptional regulator n=1 Tax=Flavobacterium cupreum TaxID=2133766 RepID=A0A434AAI3_9FLAO|nr:hypothetical protein [Flavobacterium cupreum]RUT71354.1 hypothetical protein D0817_05625 [Flavobacterium cupreum]
MKKLYLNTGGINTIFTDLENSFEGTLTTDNNDYNVAVSSKWAKGTISGMSFQNKMSYIQFDMIFSDEVTLSIESFHCAPVFFAYCSAGNLKHTFGANGNTTSLKKGQSGIMSNNTTINNVLYFERNKPVKILLIGVPTATFQMDEDADLLSKMSKMFINSGGNYMYVGAQNHKIAEKLIEFDRIPQKGIVKNLLKESILNSIVEIEVLQHSYNYSSLITPILDLATKQIDEIRKISNVNIYEVLTSIGHAGKNFPRFFKEKYQLINKYSQNSLAKTA